MSCNVIASHTLFGLCFDNNLLIESTSLSCSFLYLSNNFFGDDAKSNANSLEFLNVLGHNSLLFGIGVIGHEIGSIFFKNWVLFIFELRVSFINAERGSNTLFLKLSGFLLAVSSTDLFCVFLGFKL